MDIGAMQEWCSAIDRLSHSQRKKILQSIPPVEIEGVKAPLLASPIVVEQDLYNAFTSAAQSLVDASVSIECHEDFKPGNVIYDTLYESLSLEGKKLVEKSARPSPEQIKKRFRRLDGFITVDGRPTFIEINQSAPLAISFYERAMDLYRLIDEDRQLQGHLASSLYDDLSEWFISELSTLVESQKATVAVSLERGYPAKFADLPTACRGISEAARKKGWDIRFILAEPTAFSLRNDGPLVNDEQFDLLWRNTVYLKNYTEGIDEYNRIRYSSKPMVNDLDAWMFRSKGFFAMIWDNTLNDDFAGLGVNSKKLREIVPESYFVTKHRPENKDNWILKRCDDGFGRGIVFGADIDSETWESYLSGAHGHDWILQRLVEPLVVKVPVITTDGQVDMREGVCDFDPYVINGKVSGVIVRALPHKSNAVKMNIVEGAAIGVMTYASEGNRT